MSLSVSFQQPPPEQCPSMRTRKKLRTRLAIQDAALDLFAAQGYDATSVEQIAQAAEVSPSTFFRYFAAKADIILNDHDTLLPELCAAIRAQPLDCPEFEAIRRALQAVWVPHVDAARTLRTVKAIAQSAFLRGVAYDVGRCWVDVVAAALLERRGQPEASEECHLVARTALGVFGMATEQWAVGETSEDFGELIDRGFLLMERIRRG